MFGGNFYFFFGNVSVHFYQFHAVAQWSRHGRNVVGSSDEQHFRQVVVDVEKVVVERAVLFGVEHFEQSRRRVAVYVVG